MSKDTVNKQDVIKLAENDIDINKAIDIIKDSHIFKLLTKPGYKQGVRK